MPDLKPIKIATLGVSKDFQESLIPTIIRSLGFMPTWTAPSNCQLLIYGPFSGSMTIEDVADQIRGNGINVQLGKTLTVGFDANADGFSDFLVGSSQINTQSGEAYLFYGGEGY